MTQLIINGTEYPEVKRNNYKCYKQDLGVTKRMISSRIVTEIRAQVWVIEYAVDYLDNNFMRTCLTDLRSNQELTVQFLTPDDDSLMTSTFRCTVKPTPTFMWDVDGKGLWNNVSFTLEEVKGA